MNTLDIFIEENKTPLLVLWLISCAVAFQNPCPITIVLAQFTCVLAGYNFGYLVGEVQDWVYNDY